MDLHSICNLYGHVFKTKISNNMFYLPNFLSEIGHAFHFGLIVCAAICKNVIYKESDVFNKPSFKKDHEPNIELSLNCIEHHFGELFHPCFEILFIH